jgi:dipeptidyl-peptidase-4
MYVLGQWLADQGFVVAKIDNRGTPNRGRDFERAIQGSFAQVPLGDQILGLDALARTEAAGDPKLDLAHVGVIGASFGGYLAALAVLRAPERFDAAVAIAPVVDWLDYDTAYTERYLGLPQDNETGYTQSSLLTGAEGLRRPLLLIHGTADDNVHFAGTLRLTSALMHAGIQPNLLAVPGATHLFADQKTQRLVWASAAAFLMDNVAP